MLSTAVIIFREVLEAGLVVGIVYAASTGVIGRGRWILGGIVAGLVGAGIVGGFSGQIAEAVEGIGQEIFNASVLLTATAMLGWHNVWMERHGREIAQQVKRVGESVRAGNIPLYALAGVVAVAVLREGSEVVLFMYGLLAGGASDMVLGSVLGLGAGVMVGGLIYFGLLGIPQRYLFSVTGILILLLAAGLASQAANYLVQADLLPTLGGPLWDSSRMLSENSLFGETLKILIGYDDRPLGIQAVFYLATLTLIGGTMFAVRTNRSVAPAAATAMLLITVAAMTPEPVFAHHKVYSPIVEVGEAEIEFRGHYDSDSNNAIEGGQSYKLTFGYGFTDRWFSELIVQYGVDGTGSSSISAYELENIFQFTEQGEYWADWGLLLEYVAEVGGPDKIEFGPLMAHEFGNVLLNANLVFEREIGSGASSDIEMEYQWDLRWRGNPAFEPGLQMYGKFGAIDDISWDGNRQHIGPAFFGMVNHDNGHWRYDASLLFGITGASNDATIRFNVEYEWYP
jgi:FTR1 family protein